MWYMLFPWTTAGQAQRGKDTGKAYTREKFGGAVKGFCYGQGQGQHPGNILPPAPSLRRRTKEKTERSFCRKESILSFKVLGWKIRDVNLLTASWCNHSRDDKHQILVWVTTEQARLYLKHDLNVGCWSLVITRFCLASWSPAKTTGSRN